ncbi:MAG: dTDP-4-dehydrorhamnose reductase, partial [Acidobacteria bacterium]
ADQVGSPTSTRDLARMIRNLVRMDARGTLNVTNEGSCSWFEFAQETLRQAGRGSVFVSPITTAEARRAAGRPSYSVLSPASLNALGLRMRPWREALSAYLKELREMGNLV